MSIVKLEKGWQQTVMAFNAVLFLEVWAERSMQGTKDADCSRCTSVLIGFFVQGVIVLERKADADFCYHHHFLRCLFISLAGRCGVVGEDPLQCMYAPAAAVWVLCSGPWAALCAVGDCSVCCGAVPKPAESRKAWRELNPSPWCWVRHTGREGKKWIKEGNLEMERWIRR